MRHRAGFALLHRRGSNITTRGNDNGRLELTLYRSTRATRPHRHRLSASHSFRGFVSGDRSRPASVKTAGQPCFDAQCADHSETLSFVAIATAVSNYAAGRASQPPMPIAAAEQCRCEPDMVGAVNIEPRLIFVPPASHNRSCHRKRCPRPVIHGIKRVSFAMIQFMLALRQWVVGVPTQRELLRGRIAARRLDDMVMPPRSDLVDARVRRRSAFSTAA